jgi:RimJ/RimL family protein N-acetyltransferase
LNDEARKRNCQLQEGHPAQGSIPGPAYRIHTERLVVRCWSPPDASLVVAPFEVSLSSLVPWVPWVAGEENDLEQRLACLRRFRSEFDSGGQLVYGIFNCPETQLLGNSGLHICSSATTRLITCWIYKDFLNQGLATEAVSALIKVAFEIERVQRVEMHSDPDNTRSTAVPGKLGFVHEATMRKCDQMTNGEMRDTMIWTMLAEDYPASPAASTKVEAFDVIGRRIL